MYQDKWTRYHHKPVKDGEPASNNGWIYTSVARKLGFKFDRDKLQECYNLCETETVPIKVKRSPDQRFPPLSKDEVIGLISLGLLELL